MIPYRIFASHLGASVIGGIAALASCKAKKVYDKKSYLKKAGKMRKKASDAFCVEKLEWTKDRIAPCPYCGLPRIVEKWEEGWLEIPTHYVVEHADIKAAVRADCPELYVSFDSAEEAIEKMNRRA